MSDVRPGVLGQRLLAVGVGLWVAALFLAPSAVFPAGSFICHQRPERSFFVHGRQMPVCARCTGLYVGAALAAPLAILAASSLAAARARRLLILAALPTLASWSAEFTGLAHPSNLLRAVLALPLGFAAAWLVMGTLDGSRPQPKPHDRAPAPGDPL